MVRESKQYDSEYGNTGCWVFKRGVQNWKYVCLKINIPKGSYWILRIGVMEKCQKVPEFDFQSQFSMSKIIGFFLNFFTLKNTNIGAHFCYWHFLITSISKSLHFLKRCPIFDTSPLHQFSKFNNFLWVYWFLGKNLSNFVPPACKFDDPCYHNSEISFFNLTFQAWSWTVLQQAGAGIWWYALHQQSRQ